MLANIKFKAIEDLKMTRAEEYDYDKFLSDSSDDYPRYDEGLSQDEVGEDNGVSLIEGMIRQSTNNPVKNYEVLKNGKSIGLEGTLQVVIELIRDLESDLNRVTEHSPYTIGLVNE